MLFVGKCIAPKIILLSEINQTKKGKYDYFLSHMKARSKEKMKVNLNVVLFVEKLTGGGGEVRLWRTCDQSTLEVHLESSE
jgi:hypothetical protein